MFETVNPFNFTGPQFLLLYAICLGIVSAITIAWRILPWVAPGESAVARGKPLDIWELAYLRGRDLAVAQTAVVDLSSAKLIEADKEKTKLIATSLEPKKQLSAVPMAIFRAAQSAGGVSAARLPKAVAFECKRIHENLMDRGYLRSWSGWFGVVWPGYFGFGALLAFGLCRAIIGIDRGKPIGYLVLMLLLTAAVGLALTYTRFLTASGKKALDDSTADIERLRRSPAVEPVGVPTGDPIPALATWTFAVMGLATAQNMLDPSINELIKKQGMADGGSGSGCAGGGCAGGGCGGDGGGGGGGCGS